MGEEEGDASEGGSAVSDGEERRRGGRDILGWNGFIITGLNVDGGSERERREFS